ncbi:hypothetical protein ES703_39218 [subsurface metagenome]
MAYYTALGLGIYHECRNCRVGNNIEAENLVKGRPKPFKGRDGKIRRPRLCKKCAKLHEKGRCTPGVPDPSIVKKGGEISPYYSSAELKPKIYHLCPNCYLGNNIEELNLSNGKPQGAELCQNCTRLRNKGKCVSGTMIPANSK